MRYLALIALALVVHTGAVAAEWRSTGESTFAFATTFEGEPIGGTFGRFDVCFEFDPESPGDAHLFVTVRLAAADMGDEDMNAVLFDEAWFDVARFDEAVFESRSVEAGPDHGFVANGTLKLKGFESDVGVPFMWSSDGSAARMRGAFTLRRTDFGVGTGEWATGETIGLDTELEFDVVLEPAD